MKIFVVIKIKEGITKPNFNKTAVKSLSFIPIPAIAPQRIKRLFPPNNPTQALIIASLEFLANLIVSAIQVAVDKIQVPITIVIPLIKDILSTACQEKILSHPEIFPDLRAVPRERKIIAGIAT